jgi:hypothetical protein
MRKIPSLFARDGSILTTDYNPAALWVVQGEGVATRKWDGTAVRWQQGALWARYDAKAGKPTPPGFQPCQDPDPITCHHPGWVPAQRPEDKWIRAAAGDLTWQDGTYEACGPRIGGNAEGLTEHRLIRHGADILLDAPRTHAELIEYFKIHKIEGIVWWRDLEDVDCDKVKITGAALGVPRRKG